MSQLNPHGETEEIKNYLFVGEGDFSFSRNFIEDKIKKGTLHEYHIICSDYYNENDIKFIKDFFTAKTKADLEAKFSSIWTGLTPQTLAELQVKFITKNWRHLEDETKTRLKKEYIPQIWTELENILDAKAKAKLGGEYITKDWAKLTVNLTPQTKADIKLKLFNMIWTQLISGTKTKLQDNYITSHLEELTQKTKAENFPFPPNWTELPLKKQVGFFIRNWTKLTPETQADLQFKFITQDLSELPCPTRRDVHQMWKLTQEAELEVKFIAEHWEKLTPGTKAELENKFIPKIWTELTNNLTAQVKAELGGKYITKDWVNLTKNLTAETKAELQEKFISKNWQELSEGLTKEAKAELFENPIKMIWMDLAVRIQKRNSNGVQPTIEALQKFLKNYNFLHALSEKKYKSFAQDYFPDEESKEYIYLCGLESDSEAAEAHVEVRLGVNMTTLKAVKDMKFNYIRSNCPFNISGNKENRYTTIMLYKFFYSARAVLKDEGKLVVMLGLGSFSRSFAPLVDVFNAIKGADELSKPDQNHLLLGLRLPLIDVAIPVLELVSYAFHSQLPFKYKDYKHTQNTLAPIEDSLEGLFSYETFTLKKKDEEHPNRGILEKFDHISEDQQNFYFPGLNLVKQFICEFHGGYKTKGTKFLNGDQLLVSPLCKLIGVTKEDLTKEDVTKERVIVRIHDNLDITLKIETPPTKIGEKPPVEGFYTYSMIKPPEPIINKLYGHTFRQIYNHEKEILSQQYMNNKGITPDKMNVWLVEQYERPETETAPSPPETQ